MADVWRRDRAQYGAGVGAIVVTAVLAAVGAWPFDGAREAGEDAPIWEVLVYHGAVPGFLRLALVLLALYAIASVPALIAGGRWLHGFGTAGLTADAPFAFAERLQEVEKELALLQVRYAESLRLNVEYERLLEEVHRLD